MAKEEGIFVDNCLVEEELGCGKFKVKLPNDNFAICHLSGKMRTKKIRVLPMDKVLVELCPYNLEQGIIKYRNK